jgi:hypothetical protein
MTEENQIAEENNITTNAAPQVPDAPNGEAVTLGVADLQNAAQVIDVAVSRGAFRASEAAQVGAVYNRLVAFIQSVQQQQAAQQEAAPKE